MPRSVRLPMYALCVMVACLTLLARNVSAQIPGQNVNMVSGTKWPGGDPFLQRQNEPSLAVSSRNPLHLLAGANDYRTVDLPGLPNGNETGDAWVGLFKSFDGGRTWQSTLIPGYPQDKSGQGLASPLRGLSAASDPVVRAGTNGLFFYSGIAFNRGTNLGDVFVARLIDLDNKENGDVTQGLDPIQYIGAVVIDTGTSGQFLDKPWVAADVPRAGAHTCSIPTSPAQSFPGGIVYLAYAKFTGSTSSKIMFTRSLDCGATWSNPTKLSESNSINQGTTVAIDPISGAVYVAWRRFATSSQGDAILIAKSTDFGQTFTKAITAASIIPFDQVATSTCLSTSAPPPAFFRTNSLPTLAVSVDSSNTSRVHLAWAARASACADARVMLTTSSDGTKWPAASMIDDGPVVDDYGTSFTRGHQFMPQLTFSAGQLMLLYYDTRLDHTFGSYTPNNPFLPDATGKFYQEARQPRGELLSNPGMVYTPFVNEAGLTQWRHTIDVRVAQANAGPSLSFSSARVSQFPFGTRGDETGTVQNLQQLQINPPNLPLFAQGTIPFIGDYIDIAGQTFLPPATPLGPWTYNIAKVKSPVFYATWTSNQDVRPPLNGDWTKYTPVGGGGQSVFDPTQTTPACVTGQEGMRNQNIYSSRISQGLLVTSPQNAKPLSTTLARAFVVVAQNATDLDKSFRLTIASQPPGGKASFLLFPQPTDPDPMTSLDVSIAAHSGIARSVFAKSTSPTANITVNVDEITAPGGILVPGGLSSFVILNPDRTIPPLTNPDGSTGGDISIVEVYSPNVTNPNVTNPNVTNPNVYNPNVTNPNVYNPNVTNPNVYNPDLAVMGVSNPNVYNPNVTNTTVSNPNVTNPNVTNQSLSDATYTVTNNGNTSTSYRVKLVGNAPAGTALQLIVTRVYQTPVSVNCQLTLQQQDVTLANINNPVFQDPTNLNDPNIPDPQVSNATFALRPGETALVTLRGTIDTNTMQNVVANVAPVLIPHPADPNSTNPQFGAPLFITLNSLPDATIGQAYSTTLQAIGGTTPYAWNISSGALPDGLTLNSSTGTISGTPTTAGISSFTVQVIDSSSPQRTALKSLSLTIDKMATATAVVSSSNPSVFGQSVTFTATISPVVAGVGSPGGSVTYMDGTSTLGTVGVIAGGASFTTSTLTVGSHSITAAYGGDPNFLGGTSAVLSQTVNPASTSTLLVSSLSSTFSGQSVTFTATVSAVTPGAGAPSGTVTFKDGTTVLGSVAMNGGVASFTIGSLATGNHPVTATYSGDANFLGSTSAILTQVVTPGNTTTIVSSTPNPSGVNQAVTFTATVSAIAPSTGTPTGSVTFNDGATALGTGALSGGAATFTTFALTAGTHSITAVYSGDINFSGSTSAALTQTVSYTFVGFLGPLAAAGTFSSPSFSGTANLGSALPLKWQLKDSNGNFISSLSTLSLLQASLNTNCAGSPEGPAVVLYSPTNGATGGSTFRYDSSNNQFIFNWDTTSVVPIGPGCYSVLLQLKDNSPIKATIVQLN